MANFGSLGSIFGFVYLVTKGIGHNFWGIYSNLTKSKHSEDINI